ncbi:MAG: hypothetical protein CL524_12085 [Aequorivita sp.]|nr:hypothetical protein [Aequorivita sp.]MBF30644.1 hypothetical protein [Aequorivita sp.]
MKKVNLFIVGAMRCGTTSFSEMLNSHQDIYVPPIKEPHYFSDPLPKAFLDRSRFFSVSGYFKNTFPRPLHSAQIFEEKYYKKLYSLATHQKYLVDASTSYLHEPGAAERIKEYNPSAKIIILTRDPLERAFSHYRMDVGLGRTKKSFSYHLEREYELYQNNDLAWYSYIHMSSYKKPVGHYEALFENVKIIAIEDLKTNLSKEIEEVSAFLKIPHFENSQFKKLNGGSIPRTLLIYYLKRLGLKDIFSPIIPENFKKKLLKHLNSSNSRIPRLSAKLERRILDIFESQ